MSKTTDATQFISELSGGTLADQLCAAISAVAQCSVANGKKGKVSLTLDISKIGDSNQVEISHTLAFVEPTSKGKRSEDTNSKTPMHLNAGGDVTLFANHTSQLFNEHA